MSGLRVRDLLDSTHCGLRMDWLTAHRVVIDCEHRRVIAYTQDGICVMLQGDKHEVLP